MLEQGHLTLSPGGYYPPPHPRHHHFPAKCLKVRRCLTCQLNWENVSLAQVTLRRKADFHMSFVLCFYFQVRARAGRDTAGSPGLSLRNQFPQGGQGSVDADVQSVLKVIAGEIFLCLQK